MQLMRPDSKGGGTRCVQLVPGGGEGGRRGGGRTGFELRDEGCDLRLDEVHAREAQPRGQRSSLCLSRRAALTHCPGHARIHSRPERLPSSRQCTGQAILLASKRAARPDAGCRKNGRGQPRLSVGARAQQPPPGQL
jgi:hypothetical protein